MIAQDYKAPESVGHLQQRALIAGVIGVVLCVIGYVKSPESLLHSYLLAFMFILGLSLGSLRLLMLQHLNGGLWGIVILPPLAAAGVGHACPAAGIYSVRADLFRIPLPLRRLAQCANNR